MTVLLKTCHFKSPKKSRGHKKYNTLEVTGDMSCRIVQLEFITLSWDYKDKDILRQYQTSVFTCVKFPASKVKALSLTV